MIGLALTSQTINQQQIKQQTEQQAKHKITWPRGYKTFFTLNSTEHEIFPANNVKMPTIVGILTFMSGENSMLGLSEPKHSRFS